MPKTTPEKQLALVAAKELRQRERRTAKALLLTEAQALAAYRKPIRQATDAVIAANARGQDALSQVRRQTPALRMQLQEEIRRSHVVGRAAGRHRLEVELGKPLHAAAGAIDDEAFADIVAQGIASAWGASGLSLLGGKPITVSARDLDQLAELVDGRVKRAAATETARVFNRERETLIDDVVGSVASTTRGPRDPDLPAAGAFKVWSAILDRATCPRCFALDGEIIELHKSFSVGSPPPLHPHCRCIVEFIVVHKPERLEDIAIDYGLFKQELHDLIIEGRVVSDRHAVSFASDSLGAGRSPATLTKRFADEAYATTRTPFSGGGGGGRPGPGVRRIVPVVPRSQTSATSGVAPPAPPPPPGGGGSGGSGGGRKPLTFVSNLTDAEVRAIPAVPNGPLPGVTQTLFQGRCPDAASWHRLWEMPPGYELRFKHVSADIADQDLTVSANVHTQRGKLAGDLVRTFKRDAQGALVVKHDIFMLEPAHQGKGIGDSMSRSALQGYREMGVDRVDIHAAMVGRYTWARFGYSWSAADAPRWRQRFETFLTQELGDAARAQALASGVTYAHEIARLEIGGRKIGKDFLLDQKTPSWSGSLRLVDGDVGYEQAKKVLGL